MENELSLKPPQETKEISYTDIRARHEAKSKARMNKLLEEKRKNEIEIEIEPIKRVYHENYEKPDHSHPIWDDNGELIEKESKKNHSKVIKEKIDPKAAFEASDRLYNGSLRDNKSQAASSDFSTPESKRQKYSRTELDEFLQRNENSNKRRYQNHSNDDEVQPIPKFCSPISSKYIRGDYVSIEKRTTASRDDYSFSEYDEYPAETEKIYNPTGIYDRCMERSINLQAQREAINLNKQAEEIKSIGHLEKMTSEKKTKKLAENARKRKQIQLEAKENGESNIKPEIKQTKDKHTRPKTVTSVTRMLSLFREDE